MYKYRNVWLYLLQMLYTSVRVKTQLHNCNMLSHY